DLQRARETLAAAETVAATLAADRTEPAAASPARLAGVPKGRPVRRGRGAWILGAGAGVAVAAGVALLLTTAPPPDTEPAARPEPAPTLEMLPRPAPDGATEAAAVRTVPEAAAVRPAPETAATAPPEVI